jgi:hypothetical protein
MEPFMLVRQNQHPRNMSIDNPPPGFDVIVQAKKTRANAIAKANDVFEIWPIFIRLWDF